MQLPKKELAVGLLDGSQAADVTALRSELGVEEEDAIESNLMQRYKSIFLRMDL